MNRVLVLAFCLFLTYNKGVAQPAFPPWQEGWLDIHHISTGRGNAALCVLPDGTTLLIDAGETSERHPRTRSPRQSLLRPDTTRTAGEWLADYIRQFHPKRDKGALDYAVITHFHDDHFGEWDTDCPPSHTGAYCRTGITTVGDVIPVRNLFDRGWLFPTDLRGPAFAEANKDDTYHIVQTLREYWAFIRYHQDKNHLRYDSIRPGARDQIVLQYRPQAYPNFQVRNIAASGRIWTGYADGDYLTLYPAGHYPGENPLSVCLKITYGPFDYYTGGDIPGLTDWGETDLNSPEAHVGPVVGPVDVATLNHHGYRDALNAYFVRCLRPRVWVNQAWSSDHPVLDVLARLHSRRLYPGERDFFATDIVEANRNVIGADVVERALRAQHGHIVVRVEPGGRRYWVYVLNDFSRQREPLAVFGPYESR